MSGGYDLIDVPEEINRMIVITKSVLRVERITFPEGEVEKVTCEILDKINKEQLKAGRTDIRLIDEKEVEEKFVKAIRDIISCFQDIEKAENAAKRLSYNVFPETVDETVDTFWTLRDRNLESEGFETTPKVTKDYRPSTDYTHVFKYLFQREQDLKKKAEIVKMNIYKSKTNMITQQKSDKDAISSKWSIRNFFRKTLFRKIIQ